MKSLFEQNGGTYTQQGDYLIPNLVLPSQKEVFFGRYGRLRREYLKNYKRVHYTNLLTSGKLNEHLAETDQQANEMLALLIKQMAEKQGVTERLKSINQMEWVGKMNCIRNTAEEIILKEIVYS